MKTNISHKDIEHFYITLYFSKRHSDCKKKAIWRAYRDFSRTLRNLSQNHQEVKNKWEKLLCNLIEEVCQNDFNEKQFDEWHKENTEKLRIDYIFHSHDWHVLEYRVIFDGHETPIVSDHYGVLVQLNLI